MKIAVIGGGAAGFFSAIHIRENYPESQVVIFEKSQKLLSKVKVSGGGRCNVTNGCTSIPELCQAYPRGGKSLKKAFHIFNTRHTFEWFESRGVKLYTQEDQRVFPTSNNSQTIVDCLLGEAQKLGIRIQKGVGVQNIYNKGEQLELLFSNGNLTPQQFDKVIVASGGSSKKSGLDWLESLGHEIESPVPSLFTFNMPAENITKLMGVAVENVLVSIQGSKLKSDGALLITHWGMSGPAVLKLSAFGARALHERNYDFSIQVNWVSEKNNDVVMDKLKSVVQNHPRKKVTNVKPYALPERLWLFLLQKVGISSDKTWDELGTKWQNKLVNTLTHDVYQVKGKTTFKEEFVTCGGVSLQSINLNTMQSKVCKNLYFAGEVMDIDAITGGYNFQAAWTTGFIAGKLK